jgi:bifunctional isochorismate lyase/aryl carrier protein
MTAPDASRANASPAAAAASLDRVLTEVGEMLQAAPGELDAGTDLLAAGLDSIRIMILAERWGLGFVDLVTSPTPQSWASLLDVRQA